MTRSFVGSHLIRSAMLLVFCASGLMSADALPADDLTNEANTPRGVLPSHGAVRPQRFSNGPWPARAPLTVEDGAWALAIAPPRAFHMAVFDPVQRRMIIFGGFDGDVRNDTWEFSQHGQSSWRRLQTRGVPPKPRADAAMVYDPVRQRVIVFGGCDAPASHSAQLLGDLWELTLGSEPTWRELQPAGIGPSPRQGASAIYDPVGDRLVFIGGLAGNSIVSGEIWALSLDGECAWEILDAKGVSPGPRFQHSAVYDAPRQRMVLFGGRDFQGTKQNGVYELSLEGSPAWSQISPRGELPQPVSRQRAIYDPERECMVSFGGDTHYMPDFLDTWVLTLRGEPSWRRIDTPSPPGLRTYHAAVFDEALGRLLIHGGSGLLGDTWALSLANMSWEILDPPFGAPRSRAGHSAIYDSVRDRMLIYGTRYYAPDGLFDHYGSLWELVFSPQPIWRSIDLPGQPTLFGNHPALHDPIDDRMIFLRGREGGMEELWQLNLSGLPGWNMLRAEGPVPLAPGWVTAVWDPERRRGVVFGLGQSMRETWAVTLEPRPRWSQLQVGTPAVSGRVIASVFDPVRERFLLVGSGPPTETWSLDLSRPSAWARLASLGPTTLSSLEAAAFYDPGGDRMIVVGGQYFGLADAVWSLSFEGQGRWKQMQLGGDLPGGRAYATTVFDTRRKRAILFGGNTGFDRSDAWFLTLAGAGEGGTITQRGVIQRAPIPGETRGTRPRADEEGSREEGHSGVFVRNDIGPHSSAARFEFELSSASRAHVRIHDTQGRVVRELANGSLRAGRQALEWDGCDTNGRTLPAGLYFVSVQADEGRRVGKIVLRR